MVLRPYTPADRAACLAIFDGNVPTYFAPSDRAEFEAFLDDLLGHYVVDEDAEQGVIACGGWYVNSQTRVGGLSWGMVARPLQGYGIGSLLLVQRLMALEANGVARVVRVRTTQKTARFFERHGFRVTRSTPDGFGRGLDLVEMELQL